MAQSDPLPPTNRLIGRSLFSAWRVVMSVTVLAAFTGFVASTVTARTLGAEGFGVFAVASNLLAILVVVAGAGYQLAILRYAPKFLAEHDGGQFRTLISSARKYTIALAGAAVVVTIAAIPFFRDFARFDRAIVLVVMTLALPFAMWTMVNTVVNRAYGHLQLAILPDAVMRHVFLIVTAGICFVLHSKTPRDTIYFAIAVFLASIASAGVSQEISRRSTPAFVRESMPQAGGVKWLKTALTFFGIDLLFIVRTQIDVFVVAALVSTKEAGIYAVTLRLGDLLSSLTTTLSFVISPRISSALAHNNKALFAQDQRTAALIMAVFGLAIGLPLIVGARLWLGIFGPEFQAGVYALIIFTISAMIRNFVGPYFYILTMTGHQGTITRLTSVSVGLQLVLLVTLTGPFGAAGAALARAVAEVLVALAGWYLVWKRLGFMTGLPSLLVFGHKLGAGEPSLQDGCE